MQASPPAPLSQTVSTILAHYNNRAPTYDDATSFHKLLAQEYVKYVKPMLGEKLLDLACGTGLVGFALNSDTSLWRIHGIDISPGMLEIARSKIPNAMIHSKFRDLPLKIPSARPRLPIIHFDHHDITSLSTLSSLSDSKGEFDIITIGSAFILLPSPLENLKSWIPYLKDSSSSPSPVPEWNGNIPPHLIPPRSKLGGRLILDVPHPSSMIGLAIFSKLSPEFGIPVLGSRGWIGCSGNSGMKNLARLMEEAGLVEIEVFETSIFHHVPAATPLGDGVGVIVEEGEVKGRREWPATREAGERIFDVMTQRGNLENWREGIGEKKKRKRERWVEEWIKLGVRDKNGELLVREEGRLIIGIGFRG